MQRSASAVWLGDIKNGHGTLSTNSLVLDEAAYSFSSRFESSNGGGTNPEELIAAAHAGCFTMALSASLSRYGFEPTSLHSSANVCLKRQDESWKIASSRLTVQGVVPGLDAAKFQKFVDDAAKSCPVSKLLNTEISVEALLVTNEVDYPTAAP